MSNLEKKIRAVEDEHFAGLEQKRLDDFDTKFIYEAMEFRGAARAVSAITRSLNSKYMQGLIEIEEKKYYLVWGFERFADFLNSDEVPDLNKTKYYELKALLTNEGPELFDLFTGKRLVPRSTRKLLASHGVEVTLENDELVIGTDRVPVNDSAAVRGLVDAVHEALSERDAREEKLSKKVTQQQQQLDQGQRDFDELQRNFDALLEGDPHDHAVGRCVQSLLELTEQIGHLDDAKKPAKGRSACETLWSVLLQVRSSYGIGFHFSEPSAGAAGGSDLDRKIDAVLAEDDDLDLEDE